ncbi:FixH family protein [uncultured Pseudacidovorax sp.]|uniref:FixH family protein n=1 Tax=uncultured Pseudacidovorax sp. TaxID=679313 RepID=UPI0025DB3028|nr:FixH family protein [uncultured Pseudacidovorax sp.]
MTNRATLASAPLAEAPSGPWWRHPLMWMVVGGPAAVVVAGFATLWLAVHRPDPVIEADYYRRGIEINRTLAAQHALTPAQQARNHVTTPVHDLPPVSP